MPITKTLQQIRDAGFQQQSGPNAWYFPEGRSQASTVPRIHIGGSIDYTTNSMNITFVSIGPHGSGQRLSWDSGRGKWSLSTAGVYWGGYSGEMSSVLTTLGIAS